MVAIGQQIMEMSAVSEHAYRLAACRTPTSSTTIVSAPATAAPCQRKCNSTSVSKRPAGCVSQSMNDEIDKDITGPFFADSFLSRGEFRLALRAKAWIDRGDGR